MALEWLLCRSPVCLPLPGTFDPRRLQEDLASLELELTPAELESLAAAGDEPGDAGRIVGEEGRAPAGRPPRRA